MVHPTKAGSTASLNRKLDIDADDAHEAENPGEHLLEHPEYSELQVKLTEAEEKVSQYWDRIMRMQAEKDNLQRQVEKDVANAHKYGIEKLVNELLPVIDGLERAIEAHQNEEAGTGSLLDGVKLTLKMWSKAFEKFGIEQIDPINQPFNPEHQQAVSTVVDPAVKPGIVVQVLQRGYLLNNRLLRPALVIVSKAD